MLIVNDRSHARNQWTRPVTAAIVKRPSHAHVLSRRSNRMLDPNPGASQGDNSNLFDNYHTFMMLHLSGLICILMPFIFY